MNARQQAAQGDLSLRLGESDVIERAGTDILAIRAELEVLETRAQLQTARDDLEDVLHTPLSGPETALAKSSETMSLRAGS